MFHVIIIIFISKEVGKPTGLEEGIGRLLLIPVYCLSV